MKRCVIWGDPASREPDLRFRVVLFCDACHRSAISVKGEDCEILLVRPHREGFLDQCSQCKKTHLKERDDAMRQARLNIWPADVAAEKPSVQSDLQSELKRRGRSAISRDTLIPPRYPLTKDTVQQAPSGLQMPLPSCFGKRAVCRPNRIGQSL